MRIKLIACEVLLRECADSIARSPHQVDVQFMEKGLHDFGGVAMRKELQHQIDLADSTKYDAVALAYALCGNGIHGLEAKRIPLVVPRAHDCITLLMGSREQYAEYFRDHPGTYFRSTGWLERGKGLVQLAAVKTGVGVSLQDLVDKYGEDNGTFLYAELNRYSESYNQLAFIETGLEPGPRFEEESRTEAESHSWEFVKLRGDVRLIRMLVYGEWPASEFLVVQPGQRIAASYNDDIVHAKSGARLA